MKDKLIAGGIHLAISLIIALCGMALIFFVWYPTPLAKATGVTDIVLLVLAIDVILGPLLTFVVYKKHKKTLKMDLTVIACLQIAALCYGLWTVYQGKPAWLVYNVDRFDLVRNNEIDLRNTKQAAVEYQQAPVFKPQWVAANQPEDNDKRTEILFEALASGYDIAQRPELYVPLAQVKNQIQQRKLPVDSLKIYNEAALVDQVKKKYPNADSYVPLKGTVLDMVVLLDAQNQIVRTVDLRPWGK